MWQPAEGGEAISAAEAGYATLGGDTPAAESAPSDDGAAPAAEATDVATDETPVAAPPEGEPAADATDDHDHDHDHDRGELISAGHGQEAPTRPQRTCVGCRQRAEPTGWQRIAVDRDGVVRTGRTAPGRGAWCCSSACFERAVGRGALDRALRHPLTGDRARKASRDTM